MSLAPSLYSLYQQLLTRGQTMLTLAAGAQWEALIASEVDYVRAVQQVAQLTESSPPSPLMQQQIRPLLGAILDTEQQIKTLLQARMDELATLVNQSSRQKSVLTAYGKQGGNVLAPQENRDPG